MLFLRKPNRFILEIISFWYLVVQLNNLASKMNNCHWVKGVCVSVGGGGVNRFSMILPQFLVSLIFMNMKIG